MERNKELCDILMMLDGLKLGQAIERLESFFCKYPELGLADTLDRIKSDYTLMADYWAGGYRDPQLDRIFGSLTRRMFCLTSDAMLRYAVGHIPYFSSLYRTVAANRRGMTAEALQGKLEEFVSDAAMLQFEPEHTRKDKKARLYAEHRAFMAEVFNRILLSGQWTDEETAAYDRIMLSPTVDVNDQAMMVSAVMLSAMNIFDINKLRHLIYIYRHSSEETVRQRALVGWVFSLGKGPDGLFAEKKRMVNELLADEKVCAELTELQIQLLYCVNAESDNRPIQKEIMPDLLKSNGFRVTRNGIEERDEDTMQDILNPEEVENNMERLEESFRRMTDMQKAGSDIYFGGFSQMKRFPFFDDISNWFVPFYAEHPAVAAICDNEKTGRMVQAIIGSGPFCDSDKYSFALAFSQVIDRIPQGMREMMDSGDVTAGMRQYDIDKQSGAYIRRTYLQDVYRFFRLFNSRACFNNPFDCRKDGEWMAGYLFFAYEIFAGRPLLKKGNEVVTFLMKRRMFGEAAEILGRYVDDDKDYLYYMLCGNVLLHGGELILNGICIEDTASECFRKAMDCRQGDVRALAGYARACFYEEKYDEACDAYSRLMTQDPAKKSYSTGYGVCLINLERYEEALKVLYRLDYEYPDDDSVRRALARALTEEEKYEQAAGIYSKLTDRENIDGEDLLNFGLCSWFAGNNREAARLFARYLKMKYPNTTSDYYRERAERDIIERENAFIRRHVVNPIEIQLMLDLILAEILR